MSFLKTPYLAYNYNSLILPRLNYCISILAWEFDSKQIYKLEQKAIRIISKRKLYSHSDLIKKNLKWKIRRRDIMLMILSCSDNHWFCPKNHRLFSLQIAKSTHSGQKFVHPKVMHILHRCSIPKWITAYQLKPGYFISISSHNMNENIFTML